MDEKSIGRSIRERRKQLSLTQDELAALSGIGRTTVSSLENGGGNRGVTLGSVIAVAEVLGWKVLVGLEP